MCSQSAQVPVEEVIVTEDTEANFNFKDVIEAIDPNQISLLDQIADMEADIMDEDIRYAANDEEEIYDEIEVEELTIEQPEESILQYTDKDGNTFEAIEFHNAAVEHSLTPTPEDHELYEADLNNFETIVEEITLTKSKVQAGADFDLDFSISNTENNKEEDDMSDFF